jgi:hypothetical protein
MIEEGQVIVSISDPLAADDWQALCDEIVDEGKDRGATDVVLPAELPTKMGMAVELSRSLASNLREHGFAVISPDSATPSSGRPRSRR